MCSIKWRFFPLWQFLTEDKLNQCQTNLVKVEKELRAERDRCLELEERIQELEAVSATQQSAVRAKQEQVDVLQVSGHQRLIEKRGGEDRGLSWRGRHNQEGVIEIRKGGVESRKDRRNQVWSFLIKEGSENSVRESMREKSGKEMLNHWGIKEFIVCNWYVSLSFQSEIGKLRQIIDGQKQQLGGKLKKSAQEFKQQL